MNLYKYMIEGDYKNPLGAGSVLYRNQLYLTAFNVREVTKE